MKPAPRFGARAFCFGVIMPYSNVPDDKQDEMERCVTKVMDSGKDKEAAIAICYTSIVEGKSLPDAIKAYEDVIKIGMRNSRADASRLQMIHDYAVDNGARCGEGEGKSIDTDSLVTFGDSVKALGETPNGGLHIGGYLIKFGSPSETDQVGDYFTKDTDFGDAKETDVYYHHRLPLKTRGGGEIIVKSKYGKGTLTVDDVGVFIDAITFNRDEYDRFVNRAVKATIERHGWSSGTASHTVDRVTQPNGSNWIKAWPLGIDASVTPTPAEKRTTVVSLKSLVDTPSLLDLPEAAQENRDAAQETDNEQPIKSQLGDQAMSDELLNEVKALTAKVEALETVIKNAPPISDIRASIEVKDGEKPFKNIGEQLLAVKALATNEISERQYNGLKAITADHMKATGASEASATDGGFLLQPEFSNDLRGRTFEIGALASRLNVMPIGANANSKIVNRIDETSIASTLFGGVLAYWQGEAGTYTASRPKMRQDETKLNKVTGLYYATDELLQDAVALGSEVPAMFAEAIRFKVEDAVWEGNGAGMPSGITTSPAVVTVAKENLQSADTVVYENIVKMWARLFPTSKMSARTAWYVNGDVMPQLDTLVLTAGTGGIPPRFVTYNDQGVMLMKGKPVYEIPYASTLGDLYDIMLIDLNWVEAIDKGAMQMASSIHVAFTTGEQVFRWTYRFGAQPKLKSAVTPFKGSNTVSPFVALAERA